MYYRYCRDLVLPPNYQMPVHPQRYRPQCPLTGIGFCVIARCGLIELSDPNLKALNPRRLLTMDSVLSHLLMLRQKGPWKSVFCTWNAALTRRDTFIRQGADEIFIVAVDLECLGLLDNAIDAYSVARGQNVANLQYYGYTTGRREGFPKEYHWYGGIPLHAVVAWHPASGELCNVPIHLGNLRIPGALATLAGRGTIQNATWDSVKEWVLEEVYSQTGVWNHQMVQRLTRSMCSRAWDYDLDAML